MVIGSLWKHGANFLVPVNTPNLWVTSPYPTWSQLWRLTIDMLIRCFLFLFLLEGLTYLFFFICFLVAHIITLHNSLVVFCGFLSSPELHWEFRKPYGSLQNPTWMLSWDGMNNQPIHLANIDFSSTKISSIGSLSLLIPGCPSNFVDCRIGLLWMDGLDAVCPWPHTLHSQGLSDMGGGWTTNI